jgi:hypothetical protein
VEEEKPRQAELVDQLELALEAFARTRANAYWRIGVAIIQCVTADRGELEDRRVFAVREVRVAVAELLRQVEGEPRGQLAASLRGLPVEREALEHLARRPQERLPVPAPLLLAALERRPAADRHEHVLEQCAPRVVRVDVAGRDGLDAEVLREVTQERVSPRVSTLERSLELDEEAIAPKCRRKRRGGIWVSNSEPAARATREADQPLAQLRDRLERHRGRKRLSIFTARPACSRVRCRQQAAEVRVALPALDE